MAKGITKLDPARFNLKSFADLLAQRDPIVGEQPGGYATFHAGMMQSLAPVTPYERVIAENLTQIEWELLQHQNMRNSTLRAATRKSIAEAVVEMRQEQHEAEWDAIWDSEFEKHEEAGGTQEEWEEKTAFDEAGAQAEGEELATRAMSGDHKAMMLANAEITQLGMDPVEVMSGAYRTSGRGLVYHDDKIQELEKRRREMKRDYDGLQKVRPVEAAPATSTVIEAEVLP